MASAAHRTLFVYGSLMFPRVTRRLLGRAPRGRPARVPGLFRHALAGGRDYPGVMRAASASCPGVLYEDLSDRELAVLDAFEDSCVEYRRVEVEAVPDGAPDGARPVPAHTYLWLQPSLALPDAWDPDAFQRRDMDAFLGMVDEFLDELPPELRR